MTVIYVVIFPSTLAYLCFNRGIALIGPNRAAPFFHLMPVFGSVMAIMLLGEQPKLFHLVGYAAGACRRCDRIAEGVGQSIVGAVGTAKARLRPVAATSIGHQCVDGGHASACRSVEHTSRQGRVARPTIRIASFLRGADLGSGSHRPRCRSMPDWVSSSRAFDRTSEAAAAGRGGGRGHAADMGADLGRAGGDRLDVVRDLARRVALLFHRGGNC